MISKAAQRDTLANFPRGGDCKIQLRSSGHSTIVGPKLTKRAKHLASTYRDKTKGVFNPNFPEYNYVKCPGAANPNRAWIVA